MLFLKCFLKTYIALTKLFFPSLEQIKSFDAPATVNSASLHPEKEFLVAGGEDFKLYKYDYNTGEELGKFSSFQVVKIIIVFHSILW